MGRIKGNALTLDIAGVDLHLEGTSVVLDNEEAQGDVTTFADAKNGGARQHFLQIGATQSTDAESFWSYVWENTGESATFTLAPHGNAIPSATQPHFTGTVKIGPKPKLGGDAGTTSWTFDTRLDLEGEPVRVTAPA